MRSIKDAMLLFVYQKSADEMRCYFDDEPQTVLCLRFFVRFFLKRFSPQAKRNIRKGEKR
jgi:hypothetical protein